MTPDERSALEAVAPFVQAMTTASPDGEPFYEMLSDSLIWPDELPEELPEGWSVFRFVLRHRTCLILEVHSEFAEWWDLAGRLCPAWVGFLPERCSPSDHLRDLYLARREAAMESLDRLWPLDEGPSP